MSPWWTVVAGALGSCVGAGILMVYTYGLLGASMGAEYGWSRELVARNMSAFLIGSGVGTVLLGWLISRFDIRLPAGIMAGSFGALFASVPCIPPDPALHLLVFFAMGIMGSAGTALPYAVAISGFFDKHRGLALGLVVAGGGAGATFGPAIAEHLIRARGWRFGFSAIGLTAALIAVVGFTFLVRSPPGVTRSSGSAGIADSRSGLWAYLSRGDFWKMAVPVLIVSLATFGAMSNIVPLLKDAHLSGSVIAGALSFAGLVSWGGRAFIGYLLDQFFAPIVCSTVFVGAALGLVLLTTQNSVVLVYMGTASLALALSSEADLITYLVSRYFKLSDYSRVIGLLWVVWAWSGSLGAMLAVRSFTVLGSYNYAFYGFAGLLLLSVLVVLTLGPYREHVDGKDLR